MFAVESTKNLRTSVEEMGPGAGAPLDAPEVRAAARVLYMFFGVDEVAGQVLVTLLTPA